MLKFHHDMSGSNGLPGCSSCCVFLVTDSVTLVLHYKPRWIPLPTDSAPLGLLFWQMKIADYGLQELFKEIPSCIQSACVQPQNLGQKAVAIHQLLENKDCITVTKPMSAMQLSIFLT